LFINNDINVSTLDAQNVAALTIEQNLFWNNAFSVGIDQTTECLLRNNYFFGGLNQLVSAWGSVSTVEYNVFSAAYTNISNSSKSNMTLKNNDIDGERCIYMGRGDYNTATQGWTTATNNNFSASEYIVFSESKFYFNGEYRPLDFANNYWSTADTVVIDNMIWDYSDQTEYSPNFVWGKIMYEPIRSTRFLSSGIQA
jgi:hypothetical protein